ncbi:type II secretion system protein GspD, partial [Litorivivens sp.]
LTLDNQEASILVGSEVPVITGSTASSNNNNPFQTITRQEIGIKLTVTPQINEGDAVQLSLEQEVSSLSGLSASDIITDKRTIATTVLVNDAQTIVLGGLIDDDIQESTEKVPILGDMPIIGRLFRADRTQKVKRNLMVFIRPTIIRDSETLRGLSSEKYNYIRAQQILMHDGGINLFPAAKAPVLPVWTGLDPSPAGMLPELEAEVDPNDMPED